MPSAFDIAEQQLSQASSTSAEQNAFDIAEKNLAEPDLPEVVATQSRDFGSEQPSGAELTDMGVQGEKALPIFVRHALERASHVVPTSWGELGGFAESFVPPIEAYRQAKSGYDIATGTPPQEAIPGITALKDLEDIKNHYGGDSPEYKAAAGDVAGDILPQMIMAGMIGKGLEVPTPSHLRTEPLAPEPPPTQGMGPGTIAGDVSRALERRFQMVPEPPPDIAPAPPIEGTLANIPKEPPVFNPELGPQTIPESVMPLRTEPTVRIGEPLKPIPFLDGKGGTPAADVAAAARVEQPSGAQPPPVAPPEVAAAPEPYTPEAAAARAAQPQAPPEGVPQKPSKIGQSIEAKAVEAKLTEGFAETAGYDPITIKDQAERATNFVKSSPSDARAVVRGDAALPQGLRGTSLITAMEEHLLRHPDAQVAYELANSPLTSATSAAAQEMRLMSERVPDSIAAKFQEIREARRAGSKLRGETLERVAQDINKEVIKQASKRPTWEAFVREIVC